MKRILEDSPVVGYQLFRFLDKRADGTTVLYPKYYVRYCGKTVCTGTERLSEAKTKVKKMAGEDSKVTSAWLRRRSKFELAPCWTW